MGWLVFAIVGAGAARGVWVFLNAYERLASARDELDDRLQEHQQQEHMRAEHASSSGKPSGNPGYKIHP